MTPAFTWLLYNSAGREIRFVLIGTVAITLEYLSGAHRPVVTAWTFDTAEQARTKALRRTSHYEGEGFSLGKHILTAEMELHLPGLSLECEVIEGIGPILNAVLANLFSPLAEVLT